MGWVVVALIVVLFTIAVLIIKGEKHRERRKLHDVAERLGWQADGRRLWGSYEGRSAEILQKSIRGGYAHQGVTVISINCEGIGASFVWAAKGSPKRVSLVDPKELADDWGEYLDLRSGTRTMGARLMTNLEFADAISACFKFAPRAVKLEVSRVELVLQDWHSDQAEFSACLEALLALAKAVEGNDHEQKI